ncbi:hypothetical protein NA57DRAFT_76451 [Rhizodiscina lignyota]|uniref:F-box domain-containing protein n=1 Tax=Rhizodiscina lignyota TaxID=1504668 RepID=A0A9P4M9C5_9PEZI|nr:hypothetical protein NA57DRAFT_76451 [Rhizodiscina lignyota]
MVPTVAQPSQEEMEPFRLLDLPLELRQRVYHYALPQSLRKASTMSEDPFPDKKLTYPRLFSAWRSSKQNLALFLVNHQVSQEAIDYFFTNNTFDLWIPFIFEGECEIQLLPPVQNSSIGFPWPVSGRSYNRIPLSAWRKMRKVCVAVGGGGWVRSGAPRYEWTAIANASHLTIPEQLDHHAYSSEHEQCDCLSSVTDYRAENFALLCDMLDVSRTRERPLVQLELVFYMSDKHCDRESDVSCCETVQEILSKRLSSQSVSSSCRRWQEAILPSA